MVIFARHLSDKIKYFVSQNEILLVLTDRPALFVTTVDLAVKKGQGHHRVMIYIHIVVLELSMLHAKFL